MTKKYRNGEIWEFEREMSGRTGGGGGGGGVGGVILGIDGGTTSTICVCVPLLPLQQSLHLPDPLPLLARVEAGCSNHNSVGGTFSPFVPILFFNFDWSFMFFCTCFSLFFLDWWLYFARLLNGKL